jgi:crotonobetainyl-CoA:carnitine CoA-transferase CaiB-like acyl-CoA transferase
MQTKQHILNGYRILDFTQYLAGPTTTRLLAEMGAEVIKIELAPVGDDGRSAFYVQQNRGKKSLCIDVKAPKGLALIKQMITKVDVMVENFSPGVIGRMGLGYDVVSAINPRIVMCSVSTLGQGGPLSNRPGFDMIGAAYAGVLDMLGYADRPPIIQQMSIGDISTGAHAAAALALHCCIANAPAAVNTWKPRCSTAISAITTLPSSSSARVMVPCGLIATARIII